MSPVEAIHGTGGAYVPCDELAAELPALPEGAIVGQAAGFVAKDEVAAGLPTTPFGAIRGSQVGFVPKPCECEESELEAGVGTQDNSKSWIGTSSNGGAPSWTASTFLFPANRPLVEMLWAEDTVDNPIVEQARFYSYVMQIEDVDTGRFRGSIAQGQNGGSPIYGRTVSWRLVRGSWGAGPPATLDPGGTLLASGTTADGGHLNFDVIVPWAAGGDFQIYLAIDAPRVPDGQVASFVVDMDSMTIDPFYPWSVEVCLPE